MAAKDYDSPFICGAYGPHGARCWYAPGHGVGPDGTFHGGEIRWPADDEAPTQKIPPVRDSIGARRQPPALRTIPPGSAELLHLIADALATDEDEDQADGGDRPPRCEAGVVAGRECLWPDLTPCLGYGSPGCGMKAQES